MHSSDMIIIGSGPGGMEAAARALRGGRSVTVIERDELGGTCLNRGCIPTKALCRSAEVARMVASGAVFGVGVAGVRLDYACAVARKNEVVAGMREGVASMLSKACIVRGEARFKAPRVVEVAGEEYTAPVIIIATGSAPASLDIPGSSLAIDSDKLLSMEKLPESLAIIGGGVISMEFACIMAAFGVKVTVLEYCKEILPNFDKDVSKRLRTALTRSGITVVTSAEVTAITPGKRVEYVVKGKPGAVDAAEVLMAVGRRPVIPEGAADIGIEIKRGAIVVDDRFRTAVPGIYAIGDVNARMMLAHVASAQGAVVTGGKVNLSVVPAAVFTVPECAMAGATEEQCKDSGRDYIVSKALFRANGKAQAEGETDGIVKLIVDNESRLILGCHVCGPHAADLVQEVALAMSAGATVDVVAATIHSHPSLSEVIHAACEAI